MNQNEHGKSDWMDAGTFLVAAAMRAGMPKPEPSRHLCNIRGALRNKPLWWRWLYKNYRQNGRKSLIVAILAPNLYHYRDIEVRCEVDQTQYEAQLAEGWLKCHTDNPLLMGDRKDSK